MAAITIPIGGDMAPFVAVIGEFKREMQRMGASVRSAMRPAKTEGATAAVAIRKIWQSTAGASLRMRILKTSVSAIGPAFSSVRRLATATFSSVVAGVRSATTALSRMGGALRSAMPGGGGGRSILGPLAGIAGVAASVALVTSQLKGAFQAATAFEDLEVRVSSFLSSTEAAKDLLKELSNFADKTPFATRDIQEAAGKLLGSGIRGDIAGITKDIAAVSRDGQQLLDLSDAIGKGFAKGKFQTEELNKFLERGINLMPALQQQTGLTGNALTKAIEKGLGFETVSEAISSLSREGGMFFGLLERRSKTAAGLVSTLASVWDTVRRTFAQPIVDAIKPILQDAIALVESFKAQAAGLGKAVGDNLLSAFALIKSGRTMQLFEKGFRFAVAGAIDTLSRGIRGAVAFLGAALPPIFIAATAKLRDPMFWEGIKSLFRGIAGTFQVMIQSAIADFEASSGQVRRAAQRRALIEKDQQQVATNFELASVGIANSGNGDLTKTLTDALRRGGAAAAKAAGGEPSGEFTDAKNALQELLRSVAGEAAAMRKNAAVPPPAEGATGEGSGQRIEEGGLAGAARQMLTLSTSLARVGGGGFGMTFSPVVTEQRKATSILQKIEMHTRKLGQPTPAIA